VNFDWIPPNDNEILPPGDRILLLLSWGLDYPNFLVCGGYYFLVLRENSCRFSDPPIRRHANRLGG
jgi:hypothetical protein